MRAGDAEPLQVPLHVRARFDAGLSLRVARDGDAVPREGRMNAGADRLGERLLRGETLRQVPGLVLRALEAASLLGREDPLHEALSEALEASLDALHGTHVSADSHDHLGPLAVIIRYFISRTASRMPTKTARLTIACPMCSSRTPASAAIGSTFA